MKRLPLHNPSFLYLKQSFAEHLDILGYAPFTIESLSRHIRELLHFLEKEGIKSIRDLSEHHLKKHFEQVKERRNIHYGGALRNNTLNKHLNALRCFTAYLRSSGRLDIADPPIKNLENDTKTAVVLSEEEISLLFKASYESPISKRGIQPRQREALQSRDRAMLAVYYGCGLRKSEGVRLRLFDVDLDRNLIYVRKSKNGKERFVPLGKNVRRYIIEYLYDHRSTLIDKTNEYFFVNAKRSGKVNGQSLLLRLKYLQQQSRDSELIQKNIGLHTLRHSIATHLLKAGMKIEFVARFLGHDSLESTQIYTHLTEEQTLTRASRRPLKNKSTTEQSTQIYTHLVDIEQKQPFNNIPHRYEPTRLHEDEL